ncbi:MAG: FAD-dependent thymidylate synthase [Patescibacteria group bacterium]
METKRAVSPGGEKWLGQAIRCLDHGFVYLVDYMGNDEAIAQAARVSYGKGTKKTSEDQGLIRYLLRHRHTTPFEMVEFKFHCKLPIFVARQWIRHRTANVNEYSGRFSEMSKEFYLPEPKVISVQSQGNKQGRGNALSPEEAEVVRNILKSDFDIVYGDYEQLLEKNVARELARIGLSVANYTEWYWKIDLHNLFHFLSLRLDAHAQYEIRVFAEAMADIVKDTVPFAFKAFEDYRLNAMQLTAVEMKMVRQGAWPKTLKDAEMYLAVFIPGERERNECIEKFRRLGLVA